MSKSLRTHALTLGAVCALAITPGLAGPAFAVEAPADLAESSADVQDVPPVVEDGDTPLEDEAELPGSSGEEAEPEGETELPSEELPEPDQEAQSEEVEEVTEEVAPPTAARIATVAADKCYVPQGKYSGHANIKSSGVTRFGGKDRYQTAAIIHKSVATKVSSDERAVFIASGNDFADGLALGALAAKYDWPLLITPQNKLNADVAAAVKAVKPTHIYIAGGTGAISKSVEKQLTNLGTKNVQVSRFSGSNRYETSRQIVNCFPKGSPAFVTTGGNFADAVIAGPAAVAQGGAIVLSNTNRAHSATSASLKTLQPAVVHTIGGNWSSAEANSLSRSAGGAKVKAHSGKNRYATSAQVAKDFFGGKSSAVVYADGNNYPDALTGVAAASMVGAPIVLTKSTCRAKEIESISKSAKQHILLGGSGVLNSKSYSSTCVPPPTKTIVSVAKSHNGKSYVAGGVGPNAFDCSGFTQYVYKQMGISIPRTTWGQWSAGKTVSNPKPGDIVVMSGGSHVAIYLGGDMIIDAGTPRTGVSIRSMWSTPNAYLRFT